MGEKNRASRRNGGIVPPLSRVIGGFPDKHPVFRPVEGQENWPVRQRMLWQTQGSNPVCYGCKLRKRKDSCQQNTKCDQYKRAGQSVDVIQKRGASS